VVYGKARPLFPADAVGTPRNLRHLVSSFTFAFRPCASTGATQYLRARSCEPNGMLRAFAKFHCSFAAGPFLSWHAPSPPVRSVTSPRTLSRCVLGDSVSSKGVPAKSPEAKSLDPNKKSRRRKELNLQPSASALALVDSGYQMVLTSLRRISNGVAQVRFGVEEEAS